MNPRPVIIRMFAAPLAACALTLPALSTGHAAASRHPAALSRCYVNQLSITPGRGSAGAGHVGRQFRIHNGSNTTCTLYGYPGAQLLNGRRGNLPTHVHWGPGYLAGQTPRLVTLAPGGNAFFLFEWSHIPTGNQPCPVAPFIRVTPPNDYSSLLVPLGKNQGIDACGGNLTATPVEPSRIIF